VTVLAAWEWGKALLKLSIFILSEMMWELWNVLPNLPSERMKFLFVITFMFSATILEWGMSEWGLSEWRMFEWSEWRISEWWRVLLKPPSESTKFLLSIIFSGVILRWILERH
jgi:hypothetical protein